MRTLPARAQGRKPRDTAARAGEGLHTRQPGALHLQTVLAVSGRRREDDEDFLVCERADQPMTLADSTFDRFCVECGERVMVAPSGNALLRSKQDIKILCLPCYLPRAEQASQPRFVDIDGTLTDDIDLAAQQLKTVVPNMRRYRN
jgi:hypothetical protein